MFRTFALKHFLSLAGRKTSKPGRGSFPQTNTGVCECVWGGLTIPVRPHDLMTREGKVRAARTLTCLQLLKNNITPLTHVRFVLLPHRQHGCVVCQSSVPEGEVPSLEQDFSILLPHLQQHVKQLGHWETVTLQGNHSNQSEIQTCGTLHKLCSWYHDDWILVFFVQNTELNMNFLLTFDTSRLSHNLVMLPYKTTGWFKGQHSLK